MNLLFPRKIVYLNVNINIILMKTINIYVTNLIHALQLIQNLLKKRISVLMNVKMMMNINMNIMLLVIKFVQKD